MSLSSDYCTYSEFECVIGRNCNWSDLRISLLWFGCKWGHWDVSSSQNIQHGAVFLAVTCSEGTRVPFLECQKLLEQEDGHVICHCLTFEDGTNRLSINVITTNLCCTTCEKSEDPKLFCYTELWRWSLLYLGLINFWIPSIA